eukprot:scaffold5490_cov125-Cylindrotheca_fusiformis.AAC.24
MDTEVSSIPPHIWEDNRSEGSLNTTSNEQLALIGFAYKLGTSIASNDGIADEFDVRNEAKLLMSLSCSSTQVSGRITPPSDTSSCHSNRTSFCFTCPSLSLENHSQAECEESGEFSKSSLPSELLGRPLKVDDRDALRLSSEAMGRNIMQSYKKALDWRIQSWEYSLAKALADKEQQLVEQQASEEDIRELLKSGEAKLLLALREIQENIKVVDASTSFKVLPQRVTTKDGSEHPAKKQRMEAKNASTLEETEYQYHVAHVMSLDGFLNIQTPAGYVRIELEVPGSMTGTFLSSEEDVEEEELVEVKMDLNTEILAAMIEKSSRTVVRASVQALIAGESNAAMEESGEASVKGEEREIKHLPSPKTTAYSMSTPKRIPSDDRVSGLVLITPARDTSSPSSYGEDSDDDKPVLLSIPDNFKSDSPKSGFRMLTPQPSRPGRDDTFCSSSFTTSQSKELPKVVTPHKTQYPEAITTGKGPILPLLVEAACAAMRKH